MQFQVPQFIEIDDKIFGPLTLKQFIYLAGGAGLSFVLFEFLPILIALPLILVVMAFSFALTRKYNNKPFIAIVESAIRYFFGTKFYEWKKADRKPEDAVKAKKGKTPGEQAMLDAEEGKNYASVMVPKISESKLKDLAWSLSVKDSIYSDKNQR